jgi:hypothetical protein
LKTGEQRYAKAAGIWTKIFAVKFAIGVVKPIFAIGYEIIRASATVSSSERSRPLFMSASRSEPSEVRKTKHWVIRFN